MAQRLTLAVVIASADRPVLLGEVLSSLAGQEGASFKVVVSVPDEASLPRDFPSELQVKTVVGHRGAAVQRNAGVSACVSRPDVVAFFDDDSVIRSDWLKNALRIFEDHDGVVGLTGTVLADGAVKGEIPHAVAHDIIEKSWDHEIFGRWRRSKELYGCNFAIRYRAVTDELFDENLPLYSWLEDHDLARRLMRVGDLARADDCLIVHRAAASGGRTNHVRLGYSQVMNPAYLHRKRSFPVGLAISHASKRVAKNAALSCAGGQRAWRRERLRGNFMAFLDILAGRRSPQRILEL